MSRSAEPRRGRHGRGLGGDARGMTSIEFAVVGALLFLILLTTLDVGRALAARNEMSHALGRVSRVVNLDPDIAPEDVEALLEDYLSDYQGTSLQVEIAALSGTSYMRVSVSFPFHSSLPFRPDEITLQVSTLVPMVSPTL